MQQRCLLQPRNSKRATRTETEQFTLQSAETMLCACLLRALMLFSLFFWPIARLVCSLKTVLEDSSRRHCCVCLCFVGCWCCCVWSVSNSEKQVLTITSRRSESKRFCFFLSLAFCTITR